MDALDSGTKIAINVNAWVADHTLYKFRHDFLNLLNFSNFFMQSRSAEAALRLTRGATAARV